MRAILSGEPGHGKHVSTSDGTLAITQDHRTQTWQRAFLIFDKHEVRALRDFLNDPETMRLFP